LAIGSAAFPKVLPALFRQQGIILRRDRRRNATQSRRRKLALNGRWLPVSGKFRHSIHAPERGLTLAAPNALNEVRVHLHLTRAMIWRFLAAGRVPRGFRGGQGLKKFVVVAGLWWLAGLPIFSILHSSPPPYTPKRTNKVVELLKGRKYTKREMRW
jgi:hypothetical protein